MALVPALRSRVIARPRFEADDLSLTRPPLRFVEQRRRDPLSLVIRMGRDMPDHASASRPCGQAVTIALHVEKTDDLALLLRDQLDRRLVVVLFLALDRIEEGGVEE